jgi:hypothetical protein
LENEFLVLKIGELGLHIEKYKEKCFLFSYWAAAPFLGPRPKLAWPAQHARPHPLPRVPALA